MLLIQPEYELQEYVSGDMCRQSEEAQDREIGAPGDARRVGVRIMQLIGVEGDASRVGEGKSIAYDSVLSTCKYL
jgi:hypothetical protein